jgi:hypothetical protein
MKNPFTSLLGKNPFDDAFQQFNEDSYFHDIEEQVKPQSYFHKYKGFQTTILLLSYLFNVVSALAASYLVFWAVKWITGMEWVAYVLTVVFLFFMEQLKRKSSSEVYKTWFFERKIAAGWVTFSLAVLILSIAANYFGADKGIQDFAPAPPVVESDSVLTKLYAQLDDIEGQIAKARSTKWKGTTTSESQQTIRELTRQKTPIQAMILEREQRQTNRKAHIEQEHGEKVEVTATTLSLISALLELLFECCMAYLWYFNFRSFVERKKVVAAYEEPLQQAEATPSAESPDTLLMLQQLKGELEALKKQNVNLSEGQNGQHPYPTGGNGSVASASHAARTPIGFKTQSQVEAEKALQHIATAPDKFLEDKYTILHYDFNTGEPKRYTLPRIEGIIKDYENRVDVAIRQQMGERVVKNRRNRLHYWQHRKGELLEKLNT